jgi:hypothetical protein
VLERILFGNILFLFILLFAVSLFLVFLMKNIQQIIIHEAFPLRMEEEDLERFR